MSARRAQAPPQPKGGRWDRESAGSDVRGRRGDQPGADHRGDPDALLAAGARERPRVPARLGAALAVVAASSTSSRTRATPRRAAPRPTDLAGEDRPRRRFLLLARKQWRGRPRPGGSARCRSGWRAIDTLAPGKALGLGRAARGVNPKNLLLTVGAASGRRAARHPDRRRVVALALFVLLGSLDHRRPVVYYLLGGERAEPSSTG